MLLGFMAVWLVVALGVGGYVLLGWSPFDALFMVVITISGVGFGEVRPMGTTAERIHKKAGNLRFAFARTRSPFIVIFDADFRPRADFLQETLPYMEDPSLGIVQTPQYRVNSVESLGQTSIALPGQPRPQPAFHGWQPQPVAVSPYGYPQPVPAPYPPYPPQPTPDTGKSPEQPDEDVSRSNPPAQG